MLENKQTLDKGDPENPGRRGFVIGCMICLATTANVGKIISPLFSKPRINDYFLELIGVNEMIRDDNFVLWAECVVSGLDEENTEISYKKKVLNSVWESAKVQSEDNIGNSILCMLTFIKYISENEPHKLVLFTYQENKIDDIFHFFASAKITIEHNKELALKIGNAKEEFDKLFGGIDAESDLLANKLGIRFGEALKQEPNTSPGRFLINTLTAESESSKGNT